MIYELRTYRCVPGRMPDLHKRFENVALRMFDKHGISPVGFWTTLVGESNQELHYLLEWRDLAHREKVWNAFMADQEWLEARAETEKNGPLVANITNTFLVPTQYSRLK